jgi:hypothetical protein
MEWKEERWEGRWGNMHFDDKAKQQLVITEYNVYLGLRRWGFLSPRLHRALCCLPIIQPVLNEKTKSQASIHALLESASLLTPITTFIIDVPRGVKAQLGILRGGRRVKEILAGQSEELTRLTNQKLEGQLAEHIFMAAQSFRDSNNFTAYKIIRVSSNREEAEKEARASPRPCKIIELTEDHDILIFSLPAAEREVKVDPNVRLEKELSLQAYNALNALKVELYIFNPDIQKCDGLLEIAKSAADTFPSISGMYGAKYAELKAEVERRRSGLATKGDVDALNVLLQEILRHIKTPD